MRVDFLPEARKDLFEIRDWYEERRPGLGSEFVHTVDAVLARVARFPASFREVHPGARKAVLRRFPYSVLFAQEDDCILVLGCFHHRRDPTAWEDRR